MRRREFITLLGSAAAVWPLAGQAQQPERVRRIGVPFPLAEDDTESVARRAAFEQALKALGWINGGNVRIDYHWAGGEAELIRKIRRGIGRLGARCYRDLRQPSRRSNGTGDTQYSN